MDAIRCTDLKKSYGDFSLHLESFVVHEGSIVGLIGENGAGKSTTIRLLMGLAYADGGSIELFGKQVPHANVQQKEDIGFVMEDAWPPALLDPVKTGKVMARIYRNWDSATYDALLESLAIPKAKPFKDFSHGMKMKLVLAIALSHRAKLLILDEPTSSLDPVTRDEILSILMDFTREENHTILFSSHILSDIEKVCDYVTYLHHGKILISGEKDELEDRYAIASCTPGQSSALDSERILGRKDSPYEVKVLMRREDVPAFMHILRFDLETMMILFAQGGNGR